jgi:hypothetical protein
VRIAPSAKASGFLPITGLCVEARHAKAPPARGGAGVKIREPGGADRLVTVDCSDVVDLRVEVRDIRQ